jgi:hypothetical protein
LRKERKRGEVEKLKFKWIASNFVLPPERFSQKILTESSFRQPISGGKQITKESTHNPAIKDFARRVDIMLGYETGRVTAT